MTEEYQPKHPNDMNEEELRNLVWQMSSWALDLAQHLDFTNEMLKIQYRKEAYKWAVQMAWQICYAWDYQPDTQGNCEIAFFGENGLSVKRGDFGEMLDGTFLPIAELEKNHESFDEFEESFMEIENWMGGEQWLKDKSRGLDHWRNIADNGVNKDVIEMKVKSLRKMLFPVEMITELYENMNKMIRLIRGEINKYKENNNE